MPNIHRIMAAEMTVVMARTIAQFAAAEKLFPTPSPATKKQRRLRTRRVAVGSTSDTDVV